MRPSAALAALFVSLSSQSAARTSTSGGGAERPVPEISLDIDRCSSLPRDEVVRLAALELDARVVETASAGGRATQVQISCAGADVKLTVLDPITGKQLIRTIVLSAREAGVAARMVALAVSELVITSWMELTLSHAPDAQMESTSPAQDFRRAAQERAERRSPSRAGTSEILIVGQATGPFTGMGVGWGGGLRVGWTSLRPRWGGDQITWRPAADLDVTAVWTDVRSSLGTIAVSMLSTSPRASLRLQRGRAWLDLGAGARFGLARLVGAPADPTNTRGSTLAGTWAGPAGYAGVGAQFGSVVVAAGVEAGYVLRTVAGLIDDGTSVSVSGRWLSGTVAMGWGQ